MKYQIMLDMFFTLLAKKKMSAAVLAERYGVSARSVYRYVDEMTVSGIPIDIQQGRGGGIYIPDSYKLPVNFMKREEYIAAIDAMKAMREQVDSPALSSAIDKLSRQVKEVREDGALTGDFIVDSSTWGDYRFSDKIKLLQTAMQERETLEIVYVSRTGETTKRKIDVHVLVYKQNVWYAYAFCHTRKEFRLFKAGRIRSANRTGEFFTRHPFSREDVPLQFQQEKSNMVEIRLSVSESALPDVEEWLGMDCIQRGENGFFANIALPDDDGLIRKILSLGTGVKVLAPEKIKRAVSAAAEQILSGYRA